MDSLDYLDYLLAAFGGSAIAFIELLRSFPKNIDSVLRNFWGWGLLALNAFFALIVYTIVTGYLPDDQRNSSIIALFVGLTFHLVIRSRFTLYRSPQSDLQSESTSGAEEIPLQAEEISLKLDEIYQSLQNWFYSKIHRILAEERDRQAAIIEKLLGIEKLKITIVRRIGSYPDTTPMQIKEKLSYREKYDNIFRKFTDDPENQSIYLATLLIEISTKKYIKKLIKEKKYSIKNINKRLKGKSISASNEINSNEISLKILVRAIIISERNFSLILVRCDNPELCPILIQKLQIYCPVKFQDYILDPTNNNLYLQIKNKIESNYPPALIIYGFDKLHALDALLASANQAREELIQGCKFPLVLWVNDLVLKRLIIVAPDFYSLATPPIIFEV